jgi:hypothetical protein
LIDDPVKAIRMTSAIGGTIAVLALYMLMRLNLGFAPAIVGSLMLAFSEWHIEFSRTGFVTGMWPTVVLLGAIALFNAIRTSRWYWWAASGAIMAGATYIYNGNGPFLLIVCVFALWELFGLAGVVLAGAIALTVVMPWPGRVALTLTVMFLLFSKREATRTAWLNLASFIGAGLVVLWKLIEFVRERPHDYFGRSEDLSLFKTAQWRAEDSVQHQILFLAHRYIEFWKRVTFHPAPDGVDLSGVTPLIPRITLGICLAGAVIALLRRPNQLVIFSAIVVIVAPLTSVLTDLTLRRSVVIAPFLMLLGGVGCIEVVRLARARGRLAASITGAVMLALLIRSGYVNYTDFFDKTIGSGPVRHTFAVDLRETANYLDSLPADSYVYLYCDRWVIEYDVIRLLAPDVKGENRSPKWGGSGAYEVDWNKGRPIFVLIGPYADNISSIQSLYPHGHVITGRYIDSPIDGPAYVAYVVDQP